MVWVGFKIEGAIEPERIFFVWVVGVGLIPKISSPPDGLESVFRAIHRNAQYEGPIFRWVRVLVSARAVMGECAGSDCAKRRRL